MSQDILKERLSQLVTSVLEPNVSDENLLLGFEEIRAMLGHLNKFDPMKINSFGSNGLLLSSFNAGQCLLGAKRTVKYWRALNNALEQRKSAIPIKICYPGCGPLLTLVLPAILFRANDNIQFEFIDINNDSLQLAQKLLLEIGSPNHEVRFFNQDAVSFKPDVGTGYDILIMECLTAALLYEAQVGITRNLHQFLKPDGCIIPKAIDISLQASYFSQEVNYTQECMDRGQKPSYEKLASFRSEPQLVFRLDKEFPFPEDSDRDIVCNDVHLHCLEPEQMWILTTRMLMDETVTLEEYENGITYPVIANWLPSSSKMVHSMYYQMGERPEFYSRLRDSTPEIS